ncbi:NUDIX hydrolase [Pseudonocardia sp. CA-107938]|uniref:NUDIX hydrolase n=1 Tax=Pseudonocardia sp. CA-107938 TaxID=3240021 RepID=UPI003D8F511C
MTGPDGVVMSGPLGWVVALSAVWATSIVLLAASRVRRLDRLHRRLDAARSALEDALVRRAAAARSAGLAGPLPTGTWAEREAAANVLGQALAVIDRVALPDGVRTELADAEQMLALARRVHNDAVRDTLGLRQLWMVRRLHLAGHAPEPRYFEIADPEHAEAELGAICVTPLGAPERA